MSAVLAALRWPEVDRSPRTLLVVPLGSTEQHGPHLPLSTDTDLAVALATELVGGRDDAVLAPALPYGSSGEHQAFPGTLSIGQQALELVIVELCRSATHRFPHVLLVSGHGGNAAAVRAAVSLLRGEGRDVRAWSPTWVGDAHAGRTETSLLLWLTPAAVHRDAVEAGNTEPLADLIDDLRHGRLRDVAPSGVLGDPTEASAPEGQHVFEHLVATLRREVETWRSSS